MKERVITTLGKASRWLGKALVHCVGMEAQLAAVDEHRRDDVRSECSGRFTDAEERLMISLEAYGESLPGGNAKRAAALIRELEVPYWATTRAPRGPGYEDPVEVRERT